MNSEKRTFLQLTYKGDTHAGSFPELVFEEEGVECIEVKEGTGVKKERSKNEPRHRIRAYARSRVGDSFWRLCGEKGGSRAD